MPNDPRDWPGAPPIEAGGVSPILSEYQRTMRDFLEVQARVMGAYFSGGHDLRPARLHR